MNYVLYNSLANNKQGKKLVDAYIEKHQKEMQLKDVIEIEYDVFMKNLKKEDEVTIVGGDGTLNHFINEIGDKKIECNIYLVPAGTGNDFYHDITVDNQEERILLNPYLNNLPIVYVNGITKKFINGIGFGIDGYCCEVGDALKEKSDKPINYTSIAIKGLLFHFKPVTAKVTVDGVTEEFTKVWLAPTMKGRFYGGGMMVAPNQDRNKIGVVTTVVYHTPSKIKALMAFPSIFKGEHIKKEKMVKVFTGKEIKVEFDKPTALQIDGETIQNVTSYMVRA